MKSFCRPLHFPSAPLSLGWSQDAIQSDDGLTCGWIWQCSCRRHGPSSSRCEHTENICFFSSTYIQNVVFCGGDCVQFLTFSSDAQWRPGSASFSFASQLELATLRLVLLSGHKMFGSRRGVRPTVIIDFSFYYCSCRGNERVPKRPP